MDLRGGAPPANCSGFLAEALLPALLPAAVADAGIGHGHGGPRHASYGPCRGTEG